MSLQQTPKSSRRFVFRFLSFLMLSSCVSNSLVLAQDVSPDQAKFFENEVRPLLSKRCYECHSGDNANGDLQVDSLAALLKGGESGPAIVRGKPDESALVDAINDYEGAIILISHDRFLLEACADRLWLVGQGSVRPFDDDLDAYRKLVLGGPEAVVAPKDAPKAAQEPRRDAAERRALLSPLRKKIEAADQRMTKLADLLRRVDTALADPNTFLRDPDRAAQLSIQRATLEKNVMVAEEEWLALSAEYEQVAAG
jgi:hypothetical protein